MKETLNVKTEKTRRLEHALYRYLRTKDEFLCPEVTVGFGSRNHGRVDFLSMDTKNEFRCYEVKVSVPDFRSKCKHTFVGEYNYFVMPEELYEKVKDEIPDHVGVLVPTFPGDEIKWYLKLKSIKRAKKQKRVLSDEIMKNSLIRSLAREAEKVWKQS